MTKKTKQKIFENSEIIMEATRTTSVTSASAPNEQMIYNMDPAYQVGYTQQEVDGKNSENITYLYMYSK